MHYLETRSGLLAAHAIDLITHYRPGWPQPYEIDYHVGREARTTYATAEDVEAFLEEQST
jgi:hypothetical protein